MGQGDFETQVNTRLLQAVLIVQALFAFSLIYIGSRARENRKQDYLELTHRVTSGQANEADYLKLAGMVPMQADKEVIRSLFGPPLLAKSEVVFDEDNLGAVKGTFWLYFVVGEDGKIVGVQDVAELKGRVRCFVVGFNADGRAQWRMAWVKM